MRNYLLIILTMFLLGLLFTLTGCNPGDSTSAPIRSIEETYQSYGGEPEWVRYQVHNPDN